MLTSLKVYYTGGANTRHPAPPSTHPRHHTSLGGMFPQIAQLSLAGDSGAGLGQLSLCHPCVPVFTTQLNFLALLNNWYCFVVFKCSVLEP